MLSAISMLAIILRLIKRKCTKHVHAELLLHILCIYDCIIEQIRNHYNRNRQKCSRKGSYHCVFADIRAYRASIIISALDDGRRILLHLLRYIC